MFNFTTSTIINKNVDHNNPSQPLILINGEENPSKGTTTKLKENEILIKRVGKFDKANVISMYKSNPEEEKVPTAKITVPEVNDGGIYRLKLYIGLSGSQNSYYANNFVYKGKPFYIEAVATSTSGSALATKLVENARKYITMVYEKELVHLSNTVLGSASAHLTITGIDGYLQFKVVELQKWEPSVNSITTGEWKTIIPTEKANVTAGNPGFGTYAHLIHNYILPTGANLRFNHILEDETPIVNGKYTQYIINMQVNRGVMGGDAVGQTATSKTTHCFWVEAGVVEKFDEALAKLGTVTPVEKESSPKAASAEVLP